MAHQYGYVRTTIHDKDADKQIDALQEFGVEKTQIFLDKVSGLQLGQPAFEQLTSDILKSGDLLVINSVHCLGLDFDEILKKWKFITNDIGADILVLDMPLLDTRGKQGFDRNIVSTVVLHMLGFAAESERHRLRRLRQDSLQEVLKGEFTLKPPTASLSYAQEQAIEHWKSGAFSAQDAISHIGENPIAFYQWTKQVQHSSEQKKSRN